MGAAEIIVTEAMNPGVPASLSSVETSAETEATLLELARSGDERAFGELVESYRAELRTRWRHVPTPANGQLAVGCYLHSAEAGRFLPWVIDVLTVSGDKIAAVTAFIVADEPNPAGVFASFRLPGEPT